MQNMGFPGAPPWPVQPPPRSAGDLTASILVMVFTALAVGGGAVMGFFSLAFLDYCPPETCSAEGAVVAITSAVGIAGLVAAAGIVTTIVRLARRKTAWPFALGTLALCLVVFLLGGLAYTAAVT